MFSVCSSQSMSHDGIIDHIKLLWATRSRQCGHQLLHIDWSGSHFFWINWGKLHKSRHYPRFQHLQIATTRRKLTKIYLEVGCMIEACRQRERSGTSPKVLDRTTHCITYGLTKLLCYRAFLHPKWSGEQGTPWRICPTDLINFQGHCNAARSPLHGMNSTTAQGQ